jgi:hypothetical protein
LAIGLIDGKLPELRFSNPADEEACKGILREAASAPEFLRYFGNFQTAGPDGHQFGQVNTFWVPGDDGE